MQKEKGEIHSGIDGRGKGDIGLRHIVEAKGGRGIKNTNFLASLGRENVWLLYDGLYSDGIMMSELYMA